MTMDYRALQTEILGSAECAPFVVTNEMPKDPEYAAKDAAIAELISAARPKVVTPHMSGSGEVSLALGVPAGQLFMFKLKRLAETVLPDEATDEQIAPVAIAQQVVDSLINSTLDLGNAEVRAGMELFNGLLLTTEQITTLKALAETQSTVSASDVSRALRGPWE